MNRFLLPAYLFVGFFSVILRGFCLNPYLLHVRHIPLPHPYPLKGVLLVLMFMCIQVGMVAGVLRLSSYQHSWGRAVAAVGISMVFLIFALVGGMHSPPFYEAYLWWLTIFLLALLFLSIKSGYEASRVGRVSKAL